LARSATRAIWAANRRGNTTRGSRRSCFDDQQVGAIEPGIELAKAIAAAFHFDPAIIAEQRHGEIGSGVAGARYFLGSKAVVLQ
jgi:hypothetical protein